MALLILAQLHIAEPTRQDGLLAFALIFLGGAVFMLLVAAAFGTARVLTRHARRRLAQAEAQLHATYELASDAILVLDERWRIIGANAAASALVGCERRGLLGRAALPLLYPESVADRTATENGLAAAASTDQRARFIGSNGKPVTVDLRLIRIEVFGQHRIVAVLRDVSETVRAEVELRGIFAAMTDVVLVLGRDGEYLRIPSTNANRLYRPACELLGRNVREVLPAEQSENICRIIQKALDSRQPVAYDYSLSFPEGEVWFSASVTPLDDNAVVWVARDVTSERNAAHALRESEERFRQAQKVVAVGMFAGGIAHDFNNILTAIRAHSDFVLDGLASGIPVHDDAREIIKATDRAAALTRQLLAFSRKRTDTPAEVDLNAIVSNVLAMVTRLIGKHIDVVTTLDPTAGLIVADTTELEQVILNLAVNARDAMPDGGVLRIATSNVEVGDHSARNGMLPGSYVKMVVTDTGCGMSEETQARVFKPFFTTKAEGIGTGLGLATVARIVQQANGFISLASEPGLGTTFEVFLPCITASTHGGMTHEYDTPRDRQYAEEDCGR